MPYRANRAGRRQLAADAAEEVRRKPGVATASRVVLGGDRHADAAVANRDAGVGAGDLDAAAAGRRADAAARVAADLIRLAGGRAAGLATTGARGSARGP